MLNLITKYFIQHNAVGLPGLGKLSAATIPAKFDPSRNLMVPPRYQFKWQPQSGEMEGVQSLAGYVSRHSEMSEEESFEAITMFCRKVKGTIEEKGEFSWNGLGKLVQISAGKTGFVPDANLDIYFPQIEAERVLRPGHSHQMRVGDKEINSADMQQMLLEEDEPETEGRWWIAPLILGLGAVALIVGRLGGWV